MFRGNVLKACDPAGGDGIENLSRSIGGHGIRSTLNDGGMI